MLTGQN